MMTTQLEERVAEEERLAEALREYEEGTWIAIRDGKIIAAELSATALKEQLGWLGVSLRQIERTFCLSHETFV